MYKYLWVNRKFIFKYLKKDRTKFFVLIALNVMNIVLALILPMLNMNMINLFAYQRISSRHMFFIVIYVMVLFVSAFEIFVYTTYRRKVDLEMQKELQMILLSNKMQKDRRSYDINERGELDALIKFDVPTFQQYFIQFIIDFPISVVRIICIIFLLACLSVEFSVLVIGLEAIILFFQRHMGKKLERQSLKVREKFSFWNELISNIINSMKYINYIGAERYLKNKYESTYNQYIYECKIHSKLTSQTNAIVELLLNFNTILVLCFGSLKIFYGNMEVGVLIPLVQYVGMFFGSVSSSIEIIVEAQSQKKSIINVIDILKVNQKKRTEEKSTQKRITQLLLENISFSYVKNKKILRNASAQFRIGQINYIIGKSGVGKTTIIKLLLGEYMVSNGKIYALNEDGRKINNISQEMGLVPQENIFFTDTIFNNIVLDNEISEKELIEVCKECCLYDDIIQMENKFNTILSNGISNISGGQLKRLALARIAILNKKIILLDEPTEGLDKKNANLVIEAIRNYSKEKLIIIITHDTELIKADDNVYCVENCNLKNYCIENKGSF